MPTTSLEPAVPAPEPDPPLVLGLTRWALAARVILVLSLALWAALVWAFRGRPEPGWVVVLKHSAEGAMVGALCDWFAISKVYRQAHARFPELVSQVSRVVVRDMVRVGSLAQARVLREKLDQPETTALVTRWARDTLPRGAALHAVIERLWTDRVKQPVRAWLCAVDLRSALLGGRTGPGLLSQPAVRYALEVCLRSALSSKERTAQLRELLCATGRNLTVLQLAGVRGRDDARELTRRLYDEHWRAHTIEWLSTVDVRGALQAQGGSSGLLREQTIRSVVAHCVRHAASDAERTHRLREAVLLKFGHVQLARLGFLSVTVADAVEWFLSERVLHQRVGHVADVIEAPPGERTEPLHAVLQEYAEAYLDGWHELSPEQRREAAARIHDLVAPQIIDGVADTLYEGLAATSLERLLRAVVTEDLMQRRIEALADLLADPDAATRSEAWLEAARRYAGAWLEAWHALPPEVRERAAAELLELAGPPLVRAATTWVETQRESLLRVCEGGRLSDLAWVCALVDLVEVLLAQAGDIETKTVQMLTDRLGSMGQDGFVDMLEARTRPSLDAIQFNGALLGGVLGATAGGLMVAASALGR